MANGLSCVAEMSPGSKHSLRRSQIFHNMYFILAGVMLWPISFVVVWILANRYVPKRFSRGIDKTLQDFNLSEY